MRLREDGAADGAGLLGGADEGHGLRLEEGLQRAADGLRGLGRDRPGRVGLRLYRSSWVRWYRSQPNAPDGPPLPLAAVHGSSATGQVSSASRVLPVDPVDARSRARTRGPRHPASGRSGLADPLGQLVASQSCPYRILQPGEGQGHAARSSSCSTSEPQLLGRAGVDVGDRLGCHDDPGAAAGGPRTASSRTCSRKVSALKNESGASKRYRTSPGTRWPRGSSRGRGSP